MAPNIVEESSKTAKTSEGEGCDAESTAQDPALSAGKHNDSEVDGSVSVANASTEGLPHAIMPSKHDECTSDVVHGSSTVECPPDVTPVTPALVPLDSTPKKCIGQGQFLDVTETPFRPFGKEKEDVVQFVCDGGGVKFGQQSSLSFRGRELTTKISIADGKTQNKVAIQL